MLEHYVDRAPAFVAAAPRPALLRRAAAPASCHRALRVHAAQPRGRVRARAAVRMLSGMPDAVEQPDGAYMPGGPGGPCGADDMGPLVAEVGGAAAAAAADGGNDGGGDARSGGGSGGGSGSGGSGKGEDGDSDDASLPADMRAALAFGSLGRDAVTRYRAGLRNPLLAACLSFGPFRSRFLADSAFLFKLLVQEAVGNGTALASEIAVRGRDIVHELEYVASDLIVGTVIEAGFVWVLAPRLATRAAADAGGRVARVLAGLPANMFQPDAPGRLFSPLQRLGSFAFSAAQYGAIGFAAGIVGTAITYALLSTRKLVDRSYVPEREQPAVLPNAAGWAAFMVLSANTRFQLVEGLELGVARVFASNPAVRNAGILALRLGNNYWGGVQFVKFFRFLGLHEMDGEHGAGDGDGEKKKASASASGAPAGTKAE